MKKFKKFILNHIGFKIIRSSRWRWELGTLTEDQAFQRIITGYKSKEEFWARGRTEAEMLKSFVHSESVILDIGCGIGRIERYLAPYCRKIHAIDVSGRMIHFARKINSHANVEFSRLDAIKIGAAFPENHFDFIFCLNVLQHVDKRVSLEIFKQIHRTLKSNGIAFLEFLNFIDPHWFKKFLEQNTNDPAHMRFHTEPEVKEMLSSIGFKVKTKKNGIIHAICQKT